MPVHTFTCEYRVQGAQLWCRVVSCKPCELARACLPLPTPQYLGLLRTALTLYKPAGLPDALGTLVRDRSSGLLLVHTWRPFSLLVSSTPSQPDQLASGGPARPSRPRLRYVDLSSPIVEYLVVPPNIYLAFRLLNICYQLVCPRILPYFTYTSKRYHTMNRCLSASVRKSYGPMLWQLYIYLCMNTRINRCLFSFSTKILYCISYIFLYMNTTAQSSNV